MYYTTALNDAITQKYFLNCFIVFLLYYSLKILQQSLQAAIHFFHIRMDHNHCVNNEIHISCDPDSPTYMKVLFSCITPEKWAKKAKLKVCGKSPHLCFRLRKETHLWAKAYGFRSFVLPLFCAYRLYLLLKTLLTESVCMDKQMWVDRYRHTFPKIIN